MNDVSLDLVSVVIPLYNAEKYVEEAINSVLSQTYSNIEIIIVDDGSSDRSVDIVRGFSERITLVQQPNSGPAAARNRGVKEAKGKWIAFLDADDIWMNNKISKQIELLDEKSWGYCDSQFLGGANDGKYDSQLNKKYSGNVLEALTCSNFIGTSGVIIERSVFLETGGFDGSLRSIQDWDLWMRIASKHEVSYVDAPLVKYRVHSESTSRSARKTLPNHMRVIEKAFGKNGAASSVMHLRDKTKANSCGICSYIAEEEGDLSFALSCAIKSFWFHMSISRFVRLTKLCVKFGLKLLGLRKS